jgi:hypothetical protein
MTSEVDVTRQISPETGRTTSRRAPHKVKVETRDLMKDRIFRRIILIMLALLILAFVQSEEVRAGGNISVTRQFNPSANAAVRPRSCHWLLPGSISTPWLRGGMIMPESFSF